MLKKTSIRFFLELQLYWRNLKHYQLSKCLSSEEITKLITSGRISLPAKAAAASRIAKVTITFAMPYYENKFGDEPADFVVPKLDMVATADSVEGPVTFRFQAPLLRPPN